MQGPAQMSLDHPQLSQLSQGAAESRGLGGRPAKRHFRPI